MTVYTVENTAGIGKPVKVFLNGEEVEHCIEASPSQSYLVRCKLDSDGRIYAEGKNVATERVEGIVTVEYI